MRIGLIRHGETEWNARGLLQGSSDVPLNERGEEQARDAARLLRGAGWQHLATSPLVRARRTAALIREATGLGEPTVLPGFAERSFGELEGTDYWQPDGTRAPLDHPSVEPVEAVQARARAALDGVADAHPDGRVLVVAHGSVIRVLLDTLLVEPAPHLTNLSLSVIEREPNGRLVVTIANGYPLPASASR